MADRYHHGDLRQAVLDRAVEVIGVEGPSLFSLRSLAADLGVSHTAPRHHFGSREGVLTAVAQQGFELLTSALRSVREAGGSFLEVGVAYVDFAISHPAHFQVMFTPALLDEDAPGLQSARAAAFDEIRFGVDSLEGQGLVQDTAAATIAGWSLVHGLATLALTGNLDSSKLSSLVGDADLLDLAARAAGMLYGSPDPTQDTSAGPEADSSDPEADTSDPEASR